MNNRELEKMLDSCAVPNRPDAYWEDFPRVVRSRLRQTSHVPAVAFTNPLFARAGWAVMALAACLAILFVVRQHRGRLPSEPIAGSDILANATVVREILAMFPNRVRAIVNDEHGLNMILSEQGDVPASPPLYVRVCDGSHCSSFVTFSGQEIHAAGQSISVLADAAGSVILTGNSFLWSGNNKLGEGTHLRFDARDLGASAM